MATAPANPPPKEKPADIFAPVEVDLRNPNLAAVLAWLWPGAGHLYQRRTAKGILFMCCILGIYFFGLAIAGGHCVYASFVREDWRYQYLCQVGVGIPALPAVVQNYRVFKLRQDLSGEWMAPPREIRPESGDDELGQWHKTNPRLFDLGTLYTMIAGLLNILVIYDAYAGPSYPVDESAEDEKKKKDEAAKKKSNSKGL